VVGRTRSDTGAGRAARATDTPARAARPVLTPRALVLGALVVLLVVVLASPLHRYLGSRTAVSAAARQLHDDQSALQRLRAQQARWSDPGYIQQQARLRLQYAMPGDTVYTVVGRSQLSTIEQTSGTHARPATSDAWNERLWRSVEAAAAG
jgi:cell division protein FtsB